MSKQRKPAQRVSLIAGFISYALSFVCILLAGYQAYTIGTDNPIFASFAATVVFFAGAGVVLHVIGTVSLPDLKIPT